MTLLERSGDHFEAGREAAEAGQTQRAVHNLQQVEPRHPHYSECCRTLAGLLADMGETDFAIQKYREAIELGGADNLPLEANHRYAQLLEEAGEIDEALDIYQAIRARAISTTRT